jgi:hypothetical protein
VLSPPYPQKLYRQTALLTQHVNHSTTPPRRLFPEQSLSVTRSQPNPTTKTIATTLPPQHQNNITTTTTPPHQQQFCHTATSLYIQYYAPVSQHITQLPQHHNTTTTPQHHHSTTPTKPLQHNHNTTAHHHNTTTPHHNTTTKLPQRQHNHRIMFSTTPSPHHYGTSTDHTRLSLPHNSYYTNTASQLPSTQTSPTPHYHTTATAALSPHHIHIITIAKPHY